MSLVNFERDRPPSRYGGFSQIRPRRESYRLQPDADQKVLAVRAARMSNKELVQPNIGRVQQENAFQYSIVILRAQRIANRCAETVRPTPRPAERKVLERFQGFVVKVEDDWAHVTLTTDKGEELAGTYPAAELAAKGVHERDRFQLATVEQGESVSFEIRLIPRREVSSAERRAIRDAIARELGDYSPGDDY